MGCVLTYHNNGNRVVKRYSSYYLAVSDKNKLMRKGFKVEFQNIKGITGDKGERERLRGLRRPYA